MAFHDFATVLGEMVILGKTVVAGDWLCTVEELLKVVVLSRFDDSCIFMLVLYVHDCIVFGLTVEAFYAIIVL